MRRPLAWVLAVALLTVPSAWAATIAGTRGADRIAVQGNGVRDQVTCGPGRDVVTADLSDRIANDCEVVSAQISSDKTTAYDAQHETQVEPDSFAFGRTIVATFQSGRYADGGASAIGWASSRDAGTTWRSGFLAATTDRVSDPVVAYDSVHRTWLITSLGLTRQGVAVLLATSPDGVAWTTPTAIVDGSGTRGFDKEWIACDNWPTSRFPGRCYLSYLNIETNELDTRWSGDGGRTWSEPALTSTGISRPSQANGAFPVPRPDGSLLVGFLVTGPLAGSDETWLGASRSIDGGATFSAPQRIAYVDAGDEVLGMRAPTLPSFDVDAGGRMYVAWADCRFREQCRATDIVLASSRDGVTWTGPTRVPTRKLTDRSDAFVPGLAVDPATRRLAIAYYSLSQPNGCALDDCSGLNVNLIQSNDGGASWGAPQRLNAVSMRLGWLADGGIGRMVGDYISTSWVGGRPIPVFSLASALDRSGSFRQATFATTRLAVP